MMPSHRAGIWSFCSSDLSLSVLIFWNTLRSSAYSRRIECLNFSDRSSTNNRKSNGPVGEERKKVRFRWWCTKAVVGEQGWNRGDCWLKEFMSSCEEEKIISVIDFLSSSLTHDSIVWFPVPHSVDSYQIRQRCVNSFISFTLIVLHQYHVKNCWVDLTIASS